MLLAVIIAVLSIIILIIIHELGHFIVAKKFGVKVEEFGIGLPPRLFGKKIGETIYSLNLIPFGAFVRIYGEEKREDSPRSFSQKPIWQRALIILGGVISFWLVAVIILSIITGVWGLAVAVGDEENNNLIDPKIHIGAVAPGSPAEEAGIKFGDIIIGFEKIAGFQEFIEQNQGKEINLTIERRGEAFDVQVVPRVSPPEGEGALGVMLVRVALKPYSWYRAPLEGASMTGRLTVNIVGGWVMGLKHVFGIKELPKDVEMELVGPVGIVNLLGRYFKIGISDFLFFIALISIALALINILPIPVLDGGKLLFLGIEAIRRKPISQKIEQNISVAFFALLITLLVLITIRDIVKLF